MGGKIELFHDAIQATEIIKEAGLKDLIDWSLSSYKSTKATDKQLAVEKLWDALERLKSYYADMDKKQSVKKVISEMSNDQNNSVDLLNEEFVKLTAIGNNFRIRHHETDKIEITDSRYYDYFFQRCFALVNLALKYLK